MRSVAKSTRRYRLTVDVVRTPDGWLLRSCPSLVLLDQSWSVVDLAVDRSWSVVDSLWVMVLADVVGGGGTSSRGLMNTGEGREGREGLVVHG